MTFNTSIYYYTKPATRYGFHIWIVYDLTDNEVATFCSEQGAITWINLRTG